MSGKTTAWARIMRVLACLTVIAGLILADGVEAQAAVGTGTHAGSGPGGTVAIAAAPADNVTVNPALSEGSAAAQALIQQATTDQRAAAGLAGQYQQLSGQVNADNERAAALVQAQNAAQGKASGLQAQMQALAQAIAEHNAQPHTFQLPAQQGEYDAYQAEAAQLNAKKSALNAQVDAVNSQLSEVANAEEQLATAEQTLNTNIDSYNNQVAALKSSLQQLAVQAQQVFEQEAAAQQDALASASSPSSPSAAATAMDAGGDAASPPQPVGQGSVQATDNPGGDAPSQAPQIAAVAQYAKQTGSTLVTTQPGTMELTPTAISKLPTSEAAQLGSPIGTYNGLIREKNGNYEAVEVLPSGKTLSPQQQAFESAINRGGQARTTVDNTTESIDSVKSITTNNPCPSGGSSFTPDTEVLLASGQAAPLASLKPGDKVLATNTETGKTSPETVSAVEVNHDHDRYDLTVSSGGRETVIHTTSNHLFWDPYLHYWVNANKLSKGEHLKAPDGQVVTAEGGTTPKDHDGWMWDLTVPGNNDHDFYVEADGTPVLVHNSGPGCGITPNVTEDGLNHSFDRHAGQWFGGQPTRTANMAEWQGLIERTSRSSQVVPWSSGSTQTYAYLSRIDGKWFTAQFDRTSGDLVTAFVPNNSQVRAMLNLLGK